MTEAAPEPTLSDVLAAIGALSTQVGRIEADGAQLRSEMNVHMDVLAHKFSQQDAKLEQVRADIAQVRADIAVVKAEGAFGEMRLGDAQEALRRHLADGDSHHRHAA